MKRIILVVAVLMLATPALAAVDITCTAVGDEIIVEYNASGEPNLVRAFALNITVDGDAVIESMSDFNADYYIYPGSIVILDGDVNDYGSPICDPCQYADTQPGLDSNGVTIEMGSLYEKGVDPAPAASGVLFKFIVDGGCNIAIAENAIRGGVVMEDGSTPGINAPGCTALDCLIGGNAGVNEYNDWVAWGKPKCWCYARQCRGDINGKKVGAFWVQSQDLTILRSAFFKSAAALATIPNGICADLNHKKVGAFRVQSQDLTILRTYFFKSSASVPPCDQAPVITGPYNFWTVP